MLLEREHIPPVRAIERLVGMQAQQSRPPFVGLWSRLDGFKRESLLKLFQTRKVVRATMMRGTLHIVSAGDYVAFRSAIQPALTAGMKSIMRAKGASMDEQLVAASAEQCFKERAQTFEELRTALSEKFPDVDERAMGYVARTCVPLVMVPDESEYGFAGSTFASAESWLRKAIPPKDRVSDLILRYLAAFGPASVRDAQSWSAIPKLEGVFDDLRPKLQVFRDERKRELFDLPGAPLPGEDVAVPVRFIPAFDNLILSHADRTRIIADEHRSRVSTKNLQILPTFLVDGFVAGTWDVTRSKRSATLMMSPFQPVSRAVKQEITQEAEQLIRFLSPDASQFEVSFSVA
jgi:hypothetical protein